MKLIKPYFEILEQDPSMEGLFRHIELCGRNAYKSEDKITDDSAKVFVDKICKAKHGSVLEHGTIYLKKDLVYKKDEIPDMDKIYNDIEFTKFYIKNNYSRHSVINNKYEIITTNYRVLKDNNRLNDLQYMCEPTEYHEKRISVRFVCSRAISHELVRHRVFTFTQESQRYCNYSKDKFGNDVTFIIPEWCPEIREDSNKGWDPCSIYDKFYLQNLQMAEDTYFNLLKQWDEKVPDKRYKSGFKNNPWTPQQAREVLPNSTKTDIIMTGFVSDWKHFFELRTAETAHPEMRRLAIQLMEKFKQLEII